MYVYVYVYILMSVYFPIKARGEMPLSQYFGLKNLYDTLGGTDWNWQLVVTAGAKWNFSGAYHDPCSEKWQGVRCSADFSLTSLSLSDYRLAGTLSECALQNFSSLLQLDFSENYIKG